MGYFIAGAFVGGVVVFAAMCFGLWIGGNGNEKE